jgi:hypothetical protein
MRFDNLEQNRVLIMLPQVMFWSGNDGNDGNSSSTMKITVLTTLQGENPRKSELSVRILLSTQLPFVGQNCTNFDPFAVSEFV